MGLLSGILLFPVLGPLYCLRFVAERVQAELDAELMDEGKIEGMLLTASIQNDLGQLSDAEYAELEADLLQELDAIRAYRESNPEAGQFWNWYVLNEDELDLESVEDEYDDEDLIDDASEYESVPN